MTVAESNNPGTLDMKEIPRQAWLNLAELDQQFPPGCNPTTIIGINGFDAVIGTIWCDFGLHLYFYQWPTGATILAVNDIHPIWFSPNQPNKFHYAVKHPFLGVVVNPQVVTRVRLCVYGVPVYPYSETDAGWGDAF